MNACTEKLKQVMLHRLMQNNFVTFSRTANIISEKQENGKYSEKNE